MCWEINKWAYTQNTKKYRKVADKDIFVYKLGYKDGNGFSPYYRDEFIYNANMPNEEIKLYVNSSQVFDFRVDEGYHSYSGECKYFYEIWPRGKIFCVETINKEKPTSFIGDYFDKSNIIGEFIIPKGTEFYENEFGDIVSSQLVWTGKIKHLIDIKLEEYTKVKFKDIDYVLDNR